MRSLREAGRFLEATRLGREYTAANPADPDGFTELGLVHLHANRTAEALPVLQQAVRLGPKDARNHYNLALALRLIGREAEAMTGLRTAISLDARHIESLELLGNLLVKLGRRGEANDCYRRAAAARPDSLGGRLCLAKVLLEEDAAAAEPYLRQTVALFPQASEPKRLLAAVLRQGGRFTEAIPLLEAATEGTPVEAAMAYYDLALSKKMTAADAPLLEQMRALLAYDPLPDLHRPQLHFSLGKALDDMGDYAGAMRHFDEANRAIHRHNPFDRARFAVGVKRVIASFTPEFFAQHAAAGSTSERPLLILGMPRSGTTLVEQIVSSHPRVAAGGELMFWNNTAEAMATGGIGRVDAAYIGRIASEYEALLRTKSADVMRVTDKAPGNILWIGLIHAIFPNAHIIHCRRHPVDTCLSNYFTSFGEPVPFAYSKADLAFYYRQYARLMAHWRAVLPAECFLEVNYEELVADPEPMTRRIIAFCGLEWDDACLRPQDNERQVRTASMWQARQPTYRSSTERWRRYEPWLEELRELLDLDSPPPPFQRSREALAAIQRAAGLRQAGKLDDAIRALVEASRLSENDPWIENEVGLIHLARNAWADAADGFERAIALDSDFAFAHYNLGFARERLRQPAAAIDAYQRAVALAPELAEAHSRLGNLLHAQGRRAEALACFEQAAAAAPDSTLGRLNRVKLLLEQEQPAEAEAVLRLIVADDASSSEAWRLLGNCLRETGRFDEAVDCLERAIKSYPRQVAAYHDLAQAKRLTTADETLVARMQARLRGTDINDFERTLLHFALGKAYDDLGRWQDAINHFDAGNRSERAGLSFDREAFAAGVDRLIGRVTPEKLATARPNGEPDELPILIVGMPRSGTTLVEQIVSSHPLIVAGGELRFWNEHAQATIDAGEEALRGMARDYLSLLRRIGPDARRVTDKMPFNFLWAGLIHLALPNARLIHCRRDPIDTCLSIYFTRFATRQDFAYDRGDLVFYYRQYERLMAYWRSVLPADRLLEVDYEMLTANPEAETRRLIAFCGLEWDDACLRPESNRRVVKTASMWQARQPVYRSSVQRWRNYEPWLGELAGLRGGDK